MIPGRLLWTTARKGCREESSGWMTAATLTLLASKLALAGASRSRSTWLLKSRNTATDTSARSLRNIVCLGKKQKKEVVKKVMITKNQKKVIQTDKLRLSLPQYLQHPTLKRSLHLTFEKLLPTIASSFSGLMCFTTNSYTHFKVGPFFKVVASKETC